MGKVVHLSSVHQATDSRILYKEAKTLVRAGHDVVLIVPHDSDDVIENVRIRALPRSATRFQRWFRTLGMMVLAAIDEHGDVYHFHDPELIFVGLILKIFGKKVIYDVHEDVPRHIMANKPYIPRALRRPLSLAAEFMERGAGRVFDAIVATTPTILRRFPVSKTVLVRNFPVLEELATTPVVTGSTTIAPLIVYAGGLTALRGIRELIDAVGLLPNHLNARLVLAGTFTPDGFEEEVKSRPGWARVEFRGWLGRSEVNALLAQAVVGVVTLHPIPTYMESYPIKMFEYMAHGLPVLASDFPLWQEMVVATGSGLCVDPLNPQAIADALEVLLTHPERTQDMGQCGRNAVKSTYNWATEAASLVSLYEKLIG